MKKYSPLDINDPSHTESFLSNSRSSTESRDNAENNQTLAYREPSWFRRHVYSAAFHILFIVVTLFLCLIYTNWIASRCSGCPQYTNSPARDVIEFQERQFELFSIYLADGTMNPDKPSDFNGDPRPELDESWKNLTQYQNIRVQEEELDQFVGDENLIELSDGSGYYATVAVFHGLHCVERLHHFIHRDVYYSGISDDDDRRLSHHTEHCLDWLRQYVQCNVDTTLMLLRWDPNQASPIARDDGRHQCVNWDRLESWVEQRSFDPFEPGLLVHPVFGNAFSEDSKGDKIGIVDNVPSHSTEASADRNDTDP